MTIVRRPSNCGEMMSLRQAMDRLFDDDHFRPIRWTAGGHDGPASESRFVPASKPAPAEHARA